MNTMGTICIQICYRQVIDHTSERFFEKAVLQTSYQEFLLKVQTYNTDGRYDTFTQLVAQDGRANSLHYKTGFPVIPLIEQLRNVIPGWWDNAGNPVFFETYDFKLIESSITRQDQHAVAITYTTPRLYLLNSFGSYLLLKKVTPVDAYDGNEPFMIPLQQGVSINYYETI